MSSSQLVNSSFFIWLASWAVIKGNVFFQLTQPILENDDTSSLYLYLLFSVLGTSRDIDIVQLESGWRGAPDNFVLVLLVIFNFDIFDAASEVLLAQRLQRPPCSYHICKKMIRNSQFGFISFLSSPLWLNKKKQAKITKATTMITFFLHGEQH